MMPTPSRALGSLDILPSTVDASARCDETRSPKQPSHAIRRPQPAAVRHASLAKRVELACHFGKKPCRPRDNFSVFRAARAA